MLGSTCFGHHYAHHQEFTTMTLVTTQAVWFCKYVCSNVSVVFGVCGVY